MLGLDLIRNTKVYQEAFAEGEQQGRLAGEQQAKVAAVTRLLDLGLTLEQIAQAMDLDIEVVKQAAKQS